MIVSDDVSSGFIVSWLAGPFPVWGCGCLQGRMVDALAHGTDEGRVRLRYASGSRQQGFDPRISEWGNPPLVVGRHRFCAGGTQGSETSQYLQERIFRE